MRIHREAAKQIRSDSKWIVPPKTPVRIDAVETVGKLHPEVALSTGGVASPDQKGVTYRYTVYLSYREVGRLIEEAAKALDAGEGEQLHRALRKRSAALLRVALCAAGYASDRFPSADDPASVESAEDDLERRVPMKILWDVE
jgi:hypothetical protein